MNFRCKKKLEKNADQGHDTAEERPVSLARWPLWPGLAVASGSSQGPVVMGTSGQWHGTASTEGKIRFKKGVGGSVVVAVASLSVVVNSGRAASLPASTCRRSC